MDYPVTRSLNEILKELRITKAQFVRDLGVSRQTVLNILSGKFMPSLAILYKVLEVYPWVNPGWLLTNEGNMRKADSQEGVDMMKERINSLEEKITILKSSVSAQELTIQLLKELLDKE